jgi:hypothetical protein
LDIKIEEMKKREEEDGRTKVEYKRARLHQDDEEEEEGRICLNSLMTC